PLYPYTTLFRSGRQREHAVGVRGLGFEDEVGEVLGVGRVLADGGRVAGGPARLRPCRRHLLAPVGLLLEDHDRLRPLTGRDQSEQALRRLADVGRLPERREEVLDALLVDLVEREGDTEDGK